MDAAGFASFTTKSDAESDSDQSESDEMEEDPETSDPDA
jgi:hypothetical protein